MRFKFNTYQLPTHCMLNALKIVLFMSQARLSTPWACVKSITWPGLQLENFDFGCNILISASPRINHIHSETLLSIFLIPGYVKQNYCNTTMKLPFAINITSGSIQKKCFHQYYSALAKISLSWPLYPEDGTRFKLSRIEQENSNSSRGLTRNRLEIYSALTETRSLEW